MSSRASATLARDKQHGPIIHGADSGGTGMFIHRVGADWHHSSPLLSRDQFLISVCAYLSQGDMSTGSKIIHSYSWILGHQTKDGEDVKRNYAIFGFIPGKFHRAAGREDKH